MSPWALPGVTGRCAHSSGSCTWIQKWRNRNDVRFPRKRAKQQKPGVGAAGMWGVGCPGRTRVQELGIPVGVGAVVLEGRFRTLHTGTHGPCSLTTNHATWEEKGVGRGQKVAVRE